MAKEKQENELETSIKTDESIDVAVEEKGKKIVSETDKKFNTVDTFINVAAFTERGTILSTTEENYDKNFIGLS